MIITIWRCRHHYQHNQVDFDYPSTNTLHVLVQVILHGVFQFLNN